MLDIFVSIPLKVCETRNIKGPYGKVKKRIISSFTGISDHYEILDEIQEFSELDIDTNQLNPAESA